MILTVPLQPGTDLANVRYLWIAGGVAGSPSSTGITQPSATFPVFRFDITPPADAEELIVYDDTDNSNWNVGTYRVASISEGVNVISINSADVTGTGHSGDLWRGA